MSRYAHLQQLRCGCRFTLAIGAITGTTLATVAALTGPVHAATATTAASTAAYVVV